jgi:hypothetical protein
MLDDFEALVPSGIIALRNYLRTTQHVAWIFIASFSAEGDQLSQWRAYGRAGDSYSLGFDREVLQQLAPKRGRRLAPCIYDLHEQRTLVHTVLKSFCTQFAEGKFTEATDKDPDSVFLRHCHRVILDIAPLIKHETFREEREWRLISYPTSELKIECRVGGQTLIPFVEFEMPLIDGGVHIPRTVIGPGTSEPLAAKEAIWSLFHSNKVSYGNVDPSRIPYINWK